MEEELQKLLQDWGVAPHYIAKLEAEEVYSVDVLACLTTDMVAQIIDKVGPRASFLTKLAELQNVFLNMSVEDLTHIAKMVIKEKEDLEKSKKNQLRVEEPKIIEGGENKDGNDGDNNAVPVEGPTPILRNEDTPFETVEGNGISVLGVVLAEGRDYILDTVESTSSPAQTVAGPASSSSSNERPVLGSATPSSSTKRPAQDLAVNVIDLDIDSVLQDAGIKGKLILAYYAEHKDFTESHRNSLADIILSEFLKIDYDRKLPDHEIETITSKIVKRFPTEMKDEWNTSNVCSKRDKSVGRGILIKRYYQMRRDLKKGNLISKKKDSSNCKQIVVNGTLPDDPILQENLLWLSHNTQPWSKVMELWKATAGGRLAKFYAGKQSIQNYFDTYPCLKDKSGFLLMETDFESKYPESSMNFYVEWPCLAAFVESKVPSEVKEEIEACFTSEGKKIKTIWSLPHLFNVTTVAKKAKKVYRPSRQEVAETLLLHVKSVGDIVPTLTAKLKDKYEPFNLQLTPRAIIVGQDEDSIVKSYVRVNGVLFEVESPLKALDITFKIIHALDAQYPKESEREWLFLEKAVYKINLKKSTTTKLVNDYGAFKHN